VRSLALLLFLEATAFALAALVHFGVLVPGFRHPQARIGETVISLILVGGLAVALARPAWTARAALVSQALALAGTLIGVFTIAVGVGPRTIPDVVYHLAMVGVLGWGLRLASREGDEMGQPA
jgi:hypothetical protein